MVGLSPEKWFGPSRSWQRTHDALQVDVLVDVGLGGEERRPLERGSTSEGGRGVSLGLCLRTAVNLPDYRRDQRAGGVLQAEPRKPRRGEVRVDDRERPVSERRPKRHDRHVLGTLADATCLRRRISR